jgi:uncharacterized protein (TIGR02996 family)
MSEDESFLQAIIDRPDDDMLRLVFADWLEEHGDGDRAEFIRVQIELANLPAGAPRAKELTIREQELLSVHRNAWLDPLQAMVAYAEFRRGFPERIELDLPSFFRLAERIGQVAPVTALSFSDHLTLDDARLVRLLESPHLNRIRELDLSYSPFTEQGARVLAGTAALANLRILKLNRVFVGDLGVQAILASGHLAALDHLEVRGTGLTPTISPFLATSAVIANLTDLAVGLNELGNTGVRSLLALRNSHPWPLTALHLEGTQIDSLGVRALAGASQLANLKSLDLADNPISDSGADALATSPHLTKLTELNLGGTNITPAARQRLTARFGNRVRF